MDIWLLLSMMFVASAIFEYAVLLAIRFGKNWKINEEKNAQKKKEQKCINTYNCYIEETNKVGEKII